MNREELVKKLKRINISVLVYDGKYNTVRCFLAFKIFGLGFYIDNCPPSAGYQRRFVLHLDIIFIRIFWVNSVDATEYKWFQLKIFNKDYSPKGTFFYNQSMKIK